jgi:TonB family protein
METAEGDRWHRVQELFEAAADLRQPEQTAYLETACAGDDRLRQEVEALLRSDSEAGSFIEHAIRRGSDLLLAAEPDPLESIGKVGKYEILGRIGEGGFGIVYKGRDPVLQRYVAVKTCSSKDEKLRRRFFREGQIAAGLQHPNITTVHDLGVERGIPYLVQEFLDGEDLNHKIARQDPLTPLRRLEILLRVARGLEYAHLQGVLHRDVKPANIRILPGGAVKIMDFGIAKLLHEVSEVTTQGVTLGTVGYLAPEQLRGEEVDRRTDIFSFGVLAYELLSYERPFKGSTFSEVSYRLLNEEPRALGDLAPTYSPRLVELANRCLAKDPRRRYESFAELIAVLEPEIEALRSGSYAVGELPGPPIAPSPAPQPPVSAAAPAAAPPVITGAAGAAAVAQPLARASRRPRSAAAGWLAAAMAAIIALVAALGVGGRATLRHQPAAKQRAPAPERGSATSSAAGEPAAGSGSEASPGRGSPPSGAPGAGAPSAAIAGWNREVRTPGGGRLGSGGGESTISPGSEEETDRQQAAPAPAARSRAPASPPGGRGQSAASPSRKDPSSGRLPGRAAASRGPGVERTPGAPEARGETAARGSGQDGNPALEKQAGTTAVQAGAAGGAGLAASPSDTATAGGEAQRSASMGVGSGSGTPASDPDAGPLTRAMVRGDLIPPGAPGAVPPRLVSRPEPLYPDRARRRQVEAEVMMLVLVDENGRVVRAIVKRTDDPGLGFNDAARHAALRARFDPAALDGIPGKMWTELPFSFRLHE